jgi:RNA polymerase sigma factor (sigma-70 family)
MDASDFTEYRPLMFSIAYRMTGSVSDAEDIVQEAFLRMNAGADADSPKAYLATITTRLAIDHLRSARVRRESYVGTWLPEPLIDEDAPDPAELARTIQAGSWLRGAWVNGQPGVLAYDADGGLIGVVALDVLDGQTQAIRAVANPEKLLHIGPISRTWHLRWREEGR